MLQDTKWYVLFPPQPIFNTCTGIEFDITVGFGNVDGDGDNTEIFYIEVYNGSVWNELYKIDTIGTESSQLNLTRPRLIKHIVINNATLYNSVVSNNYEVKLRVRVEGFQHRIIYY